MAELKELDNLRFKQFGYVQKNTKLTATGNTYMMNSYKKMYKMGIVVRCNNIVTNPNGNKNIYYNDPMYHPKIDSDGKKILDSKGKEIPDKSKPPIQYMSKYDISRNSLHIFTGKTHGGYIGIDIDVDTSKGFNRFGITCFYEALFRKTFE